MKNFSIQIEAWLLGELEGPERADFEQALQSDPELVLAVEQVRGMQQRLTGAHLRKKVSIALQQQQVNKPNSIFHWGWLSAGGVGIMLLLFWLFFEKTTPTTVVPGPSAPATAPAPVPGSNPTAAEKPASAPGSVAPDQSTQKDRKKTPLPATGHPIALAKEFYVPPTGQFIRDATEQESAKTPLQLAAEAFTAQNYDEACALLKDDSQLGTDESVPFLRANARFNAGQFKAAAQDFKQLENSFQFKFEARWNLLLCEIAMGNAAKPTVRSALQAMISDTDFPFNEAAQRLKKRL